MISVIIPTCDRPVEFLRAAVDSVLAQTLPPSEIIVVDNGIRDADPAALPEGITLYRLPPRVGPSRARNFGAAMAKGPNLAFLDDDDLWDSEFLAQCAKVLEDEKVECVYGSVLLLRDSCLSAKSSPSASSFSLEQLLKKNPGASGQNMFIRKETYWRVGGFDERLWNSEDRDLAVRLKISGVSVGFCPEARAIVRSHTGPRLTDQAGAKFRLLIRYRTYLSISSRVRLGGELSYLAARRSVGRLLRSAGLRT
jgi:glycosyltransferase involved in cell wall biosynthesis